MANRSLPELTIKAVQRSYINGEGTKQAIADRFGISIGSVKRITRGLQPIKKATALVTFNAEKRADSVLIQGVALDTEELMVNALNDLSGEMKTAPSRSKEGVAGAIAKFIELYRKYHPPTIDELVDLALSIPGFDPQEFARKLRERLNQTA